MNLFAKLSRFIDVRAAKQLGHNDIELSFNDYSLHTTVDVPGKDK